MWGGGPRGFRGRSVTLMVKWTNSGFVGLKKCPPPLWVNATVINLSWTLRAPPCGEGQNCILGPRISGGSRRAPGGARSPLTFPCLPTGRGGPADTSAASGKNSGGSARRVHEPAYTNHQTYVRKDVFQNDVLSRGSLISSPQGWPPV